MVSTRRRRGQRKRQFSRFGEILNDFVFGNGTTVNTMGNVALESQANGHHEDFEIIVDNESQNQIIGSNIHGRIRNVVDSAGVVVKNLMQDPILRTMNNVVIPRVELAVRSITSSSRNEPNSIVQNSNRRDFTGNTGNTPLRSASSRLDLNTEQDDLNETHDVDKSKEVDFPATRFIYDRRAHAHHIFPIEISVKICWY